MVIRPSVHRKNALHCIEVQLEMLMINVTGLAMAVLLCHSAISMLPEWPFNIP